MYIAGNLSLFADREDPLFLEGEGEIVSYERLRIGHPESIISV